MTDRFEALKEAIEGLGPVDEAANRSLSRVMDHIKNRNVGLISANRQDEKREVNNKNHESLKADIKANGFGYTHVKGTYPEKQNDGSVSHGEERSFLITAPPEDKEKLLKFLVKHGTKYNQDSILFKAHDEDDANLHSTVQRTPEDPQVGAKSSVGKFHANHLKDYMTKLKGDRTFVFESVLVEWHRGWLGEWANAIREREGK